MRSVDRKYREATSSERNGCYGIGESRGHDSKGLPSAFRNPFLFFVGARFPLKTPRNPVFHPCGPTFW